MRKKLLFRIIRIALVFSLFSTTRVDGGAFEEKGSDILCDGAAFRMQCKTLVGADII